MASEQVWDGNDSRDFSSRPFNQTAGGAPSRVRHGSALTEMSSRSTDECTTAGSTSLGELSSELRPPGLDLRRMQQATRDNVATHRSLSPSPAKGVESPELTGITDSEWTILESGDREAMLHMLYQTNNMLLQLPKRKRKMIKKKITTIEKMLDAHQKLGCPMPSPAQIASRSFRKEAILNPPTQGDDAFQWSRTNTNDLSRSTTTLSSAQRAASPGRSTWFSSPQDRGDCLHCSQPVLGSQKRLKCDLGYLHYDCAHTARSSGTANCLHCCLPLSRTQQTVPCVNGSLHECCVAHYNPTLLRAKSPNREHQQAASPVQSRSRAASPGVQSRPDSPGVQSRPASPERSSKQLKGHCAHCQLPVYATDHRVRSGAGYLHHECVDKYMLSPVQLATLRAKEAASAVKQARANGDEDQQQKIMLKLFDSMLVDQGTFARAPLVVRTLQQCAAEVNGQTADWLNQMCKQIEQSQASIMNRQQFSTIVDNDDSTMMMFQ